MALNVSETDAVLIHAAAPVAAASVFAGTVSYTPVSVAAGEVVSVVVVVEVEVELAAAVHYTPSALLASN